MRLPDPIKLAEGEVVQFTDALRTRPILAALIGTIVAEWANVESVMAMIFAVLLQVDAPIGIGIIDSINSVAGKRNQIMAVARAKIRDRDLRDNLKTTLHDMQEIGEKRNDIAHGRWCVSDLRPANLLWQRHTWRAEHGGFVPYDAAILEALLAEIAQCRNALQQIFVDIVLQLTPVKYEEPAGTQ